MQSEIGIQEIGSEKVAVFGGAIMQCVNQQRAQRPAKPFVRGNIEADFLALKNCRRQLLLHQFLEYEFLLCATNFQGSRELRGKLDDATIEESGPHFHVVS